MVIPEYKFVTWGMPEAIFKRCALMEGELPGCHFPLNAALEDAVCGCGVNGVTVEKLETLAQEGGR